MRKRSWVRKISKRPKHEVQKVTGLPIKYMLITILYLLNIKRQNNNEPVFYTHVRKAGCFHIPYVELWLFDYRFNIGWCFLETVNLGFSPRSHRSGRLSPSRRFTRHVALQYKHHHLRHRTSGETHTNNRPLFIDLVHPQLRNLPSSQVRTPNGALRRSSAWRNGFLQRHWRKWIFFS